MLICQLVQYVLVLYQSSSSYIYNITYTNYYIIRSYESYTTRIIYSHQQLYSNTSQSNNITSIRASYQSTLLVPYIYYLLLQSIYLSRVSTTSVQLLSNRRQVIIQYTVNVLRKKFVITHTRKLRGMPAKMRFYTYCTCINTINK